MDDCTRDLTGLGTSTACAAHAGNLNGASTNPSCFGLLESGTTATPAGDRVRGAGARLVVVATGRAGDRRVS